MVHFRVTERYHRYGCPNIFDDKDNAERYLRLKIGSKCNMQCDAFGLIFRAAWAEVNKGWTPSAFEEIEIEANREIAREKALTTQDTSGKNLPDSLVVQVSVILPTLRVV